MTSRNAMRLVCLLPLASCLSVQLAPLSIAGGQQLKPISEADEQRPAPRTVRYDDIPERVQIIGKLGQPLGQLVTVRGRWTAPYTEKPSLPVRLVVDQVNGRPIDPPAEFDDVEPVRKGGDEEFAKRTIGEEWELRGAETGGFVGFSDKVWAELGQPISHPPRGFLTRFGYVKAKRVSGLKPADGGRD